MIRWLSRAVLREEGLTLVELLTAMVILTIALVGVAASVAYQTVGVSSSLPMGQAAVTRGHYVTTATMLAQERLEQVKRATYTVQTDGTEVTDDLGSSSSAAPTNFSDEDYGSFSTRGLPKFGRKVRVEDLASGLKTVTVTVTFDLPKEAGLGQESIAISSLIAPRVTE